MSEFDCLNLDELRHRRSEKWARYPENVLPSTPAETDFLPAPAIREVLTAAVAAGDLGYARADGSGLAEAFARFAARRFGWSVDVDGVVALPEIMVGVAELLRVLTPAGAGVVIMTPAYPPFFSVIAEVGRRAVEVPLLGPGVARRFPLDDIRAAFAAGARAFLLCNPHNPTGYVATREELLAVAEIVAEQEGVVISDEIHAPLTLEGATHVPFCSLANTAVNALVLTSASKGWNIPGLKCALAVAGSPPMHDALARLPVDLPDRVGHLGVLATTAAFADGEEWLDGLLSYLEENRRALTNLLAERAPLVRYRPGEATYLAWLDCRDLGLGDDPAAHFLEHGRVALTPGPLFGDPGRGFARLNFGTSRAVLEQTIERLAHAAATLPLS